MPNVGYMKKTQPGFSSSEALPCIPEVHLNRPHTERIARPDRAELWIHPDDLQWEPKEPSQVLSNDGSRELCLGQDSRVRSSRPPNPLHQTAGLEKRAQVSKLVELPIITVSTEGSNAGNEQPESLGIWARIFEEYRRNYCPRRSPRIVLPTPPTDKEKYSFAKMNRPFLLTCEIFGMLVLAYGSWNLIKGSPIFCWFAICITVIEIFLSTVVFITIMGNELDLKSHQKLIGDYPLSGDELPTIDIYLPICKEPLEVIENTWKCISALEYPIGKLSIFVLDDGADEAVRSLAKRFEFNYICRPNRPELKKSGNLRHAFAQTSGNFFTVFDADFCPRPDFFKETMPYLLADQTQAILQTPQFFRSLPTQAWIEQGAGAFQEYTYRLMQPCRDRWGAAICVGSNAIFRRSAFKPIGGMVAVDCSEDIYTSFYAVTHEWTVKYLPLPLACGICPDTPGAFFSQQMRWCHGSVSLVARREFWRAKTRVMVKVCYLCGAFYYIMSAIEPFVFPPLAPLVLLTRPDLFKYYNLFYGFPIMIMGFLIRKIWSHSRYTFSVQYTDRVLQFASLQAIWDMIAGNRLRWKPSGEAGSTQKNHQYTNMRILAWGWTITHTTAFIVAGVRRVLEGLGWYNLIPVVVINSINILWLHRFLLYQHYKE